MSNQNDYDELLETIKAIPNDQLKEPNIPVDVALQESEDLYKWTGKDVARLATAGFTQEKLDNLLVRTGACREAQSIWTEEFRSQQDAQEQWNELAPQAYHLRDYILHAMRYAYRNNEALLNRVRAIAEGSGDADMIQDLNDVKVLGQKNPDPLTEITFDMNMLTSAGTMSDQLAGIRAEANGERMEQSESRVIRDKAYMYMKELVDEIRAAGKYLFWKDPERLKGYSSQYWKKHNRKKDDTPDEVTE
ncbi:hypothetical protein OU798_03415 [Prolixibacteraceae bacterium Z1-6]|uniref:Uncharacterized protein n=1 Tax=Draconibacterium aestuarii TaxID=2998507 RepID=A0A9X3F2V3_9BACT|nr:hypothetical protein [Prolixibacteraceae bacterium Z1-6]